MNVSEMSQPLSQFLSEVDDLGFFAQIFDSINDRCVFVKDPKSRLIYGNQVLLVRLGLSSNSELEGSSDEDHFPPELSEHFVKDDQQVFSTKEAIVDRLELGFDGPFILEWYLTTKVPIIDRNGKVTGLIGITKICDGELPSTMSQPGINRLVLWLRENANHRVSTQEMAQKAGMSIWQLRRHFHDFFGTTPQDFELISRIQAASRELTTSQNTISEIAFNFGFYDQSAFSNQFKNRTGLTPREFRLKKHVPIALAKAKRIPIDQK